MRVLAAGDSHTKFFKLTPAVRVVYPLVRDVRSEVHGVNGATVAGVGRWNSTLKFRDSLRGWLETGRPDVCVLNLGQVDVELGAPYRKFVKQDYSDPEVFLSGVVERYAEILNALVQDYPDVSFLVKGVNLPVLVYDTKKAVTDIGNVTRERVLESDVEERDRILKDIQRGYESDVERNRLTLRFNGLLKGAADAADVLYFDINQEIAAQNGLVHPRFIPIAVDHHLVDSVEVRAIHWRHLLKRLGLDSGSGGAAGPDTPAKRQSA